MPALVSDPLEVPAVKKIEHDRTATEIERDTTAHHDASGEVNLRSFIVDLPTVVPGDDRSRVSASDQRLHPP